jgi:hypothetical protein
MGQIGAYVWIALGATHIACRCGQGTSLTEVASSRTGKWCCSVACAASPYSCFLVHSLFDAHFASINCLLTH